MRELIQFVACSLVDEPQAVHVHERQSESTVVYQLQVARDDIGKVIGKHGRTAHAMRLLLSAAAQRQNSRAVLEIQE